MDGSFPTISFLMLIAGFSSVAIATLPTLNKISGLKHLIRTCSQKKRRVIRSTKLAEKKFLAHARVIFILSSKRYRNLSAANSMSCAQHSHFAVIKIEISIHWQDFRLQKHLKKLVWRFAALRPPKSKDIALTLHFPIRILSFKKLNFQGLQRLVKSRFSSICKS